MKINLDWIRDFIPLRQDPPTVAHDLTMAGLEVEGIEQTAAGPVLEVSVTPNRMDCLSHLGVARDLAALYRLPLTLPPATPPEAAEAGGDAARVDIEDPLGCPRYSARVLAGVKVGPSPAEAARRLESVGVRSINNVVDATNYVMMELGQPLHAFDSALLRQSRIVVRRAGQGEPFRTLDGQERALLGEDLLICDGVGPVALAGIMGGANSEVGEGTTTLLLESACFDPMTIRRSRVRLGMSTEASYRFERGTDPAGTVLAVNRLAELICRWAGGKALAGVIDAHPRPHSRLTVEAPLSLFPRLLGVEVPAEEVRGILERLGFGVTVAGGVLRAVVPSWRRDVARPEDLVEEVARIHGYDRVPATLPVGRVVPVKPPAGEKAEQSARAALESDGFSEAVTYSFVGRAEVARLRLCADDAHVCLKNPLSEEMEVMRPSLLPGLLRAAALNASRRVRRLRLYEVGTVFFPREGGCACGTAVEEKPRLAGVLYGERESKGWYRGREESGFHDAKGAVEAVLSALRLPAAFCEENAPYLAPGQSAAVLANDSFLGWVGTLHPEIGAALDLPAWVGCFELDLGALGAAGMAVPRYRPLPRFPEVLRDLSLLVPREHRWEDVSRAVREAAADLAEVRLFDLYSGKGIPAGTRSLAFSLVFQSPERTLTDAEVDAQVAAILDALQSRFGARMR